MFHALHHFVETLDLFELLVWSSQVTSALNNLWGVRVLCEIALVLRLDGAPAHVARQ